MITIGRIIKLGLLNFWRNRWLSLAASLMIMLTLLTMGGFFILNIFVNSTAQGIKDRIDLSIYFFDTATDDQIKDIQYRLANRADVKAVKYINKDDALAIWQQRAIKANVKNLVTKDDNPLSRSLQIKAEPEALESIAADLTSPANAALIRNVSYEETKIAIDKIIRWTGLIRQFGWLLTVFLLLISLVVVLNTIRLTIFTRRDEIEIMRLVGANNAFIRIPFSIEAILYGTAGSLLAYLLICGVMSVQGPRFAGYFTDLASASSVDYFRLIQPYFEGAVSQTAVGFWQSFWSLGQLGLMQLAIGIIFSVSCSMIALRRYLRV